MANIRANGLGRYGENLAAEHLAALGLCVVDRNWRCSLGEIDIVAFDAQAGVIVFCEVKTRSSTAFGLPVEAVDRRKARQLRRLAVAWLEAHPHPRCGVRFDVVGVLRPRTGAATVCHLTGVL